MSEGTAGGYKEIVAQISGTRRVRPAQVRERRPPGAAGARDRDAGAHPHLGRDRRGPAARRGGGSRDQRGRPQDRHHAVERRRRAARQQDRIGDPHHPPADRPGGRDAGGALAAPQPREGHGAPALAHPRRPQPEARRRAGRGAPLAGRLGRPVAAHPHLQFPARAGDRPPGQPDPLFARPDHGGRGARRDHRRADRRASGRAARRSRGRCDACPAPAAVCARHADRAARRLVQSAARGPRAGDAARADAARASTGSGGW